MTQRETCTHMPRRKTTIESLGTYLTIIPLNWLMSLNHFPSLMPYSETISATRLFPTHVWSIGVPCSIVSDRDPCWTRGFLWSCSNSLGVPPLFAEWNCRQMDKENGWTTHWECIVPTTLCQCQSNHRDWAKMLDVWHNHKKYPLNHYLHQPDYWNLITRRIKPPTLNTL